MQRVVITGAGIRSCLGNSLAEVTESLRLGRSGLSFREDYAEQGLRSQVAGAVSCDSSSVPRKDRRFMGDAALFAALSMEDAIQAAGIDETLLQSHRTGLVAASGASSCADMAEATRVQSERGVRRLGPYRVPKIMTSAVAASLATRFGIHGLNYGLVSACATSSHCIGHACEQIQLGKQDIVFAGGGEEEHWTLSMLFDAMGALATGFNEAPEQASRPFDQDRSGFVIAGGGGMVVLESLDHALERGAPILAEVVGYGATSDGADMVAPNGDGARRCMQQALSSVEGPVDYVNAHATGTPVGDSVELEAIRSVFAGTRLPVVSSTKGLTGHSLGAAGVHELIYCLLMMGQGFIAGNRNLVKPDDACEGLDLPQSARETPLERVLSNSFGFGGTNASLVLQQWRD
ncbi:MAG: beta-ketoacyl synthase N-terminal-like domain-containing protein [Oleiphilaceae bacterium]|nr:beta-ketoacyl synthase N-terminal-like domain-containing protein [Oleiphilaceae bacterium]